MDDVSTASQIIVSHFAPVHARRNWLACPKTCIEGEAHLPIPLRLVRTALRRIRIESWQGLSTVHALTRAGLAAEAFTPTAKVHAEEWPAPAQRLSTRTLIPAPHVRLREDQKADLCHHNRPTPRVRSEDVPTNIAKAKATAEMGCVEMKDGDGFLLSCNVGLHQYTCTKTRGKCESYRSALLKDFGRPGFHLFE